MATLRVIRRLIRRSLSSLLRRINSSSEVLVLLDPTASGGEVPPVEFVLTPCLTGVPSQLTKTSNLEVTNAIYALARARDNIVDAAFRLNAARVNLARSNWQA